MKLNHLQARSLDALSLYNSAFPEKRIGLKSLRNYRCKSTRSIVFTPDQERNLKNNQFQVKKSSLKNLQSNTDIVPDSDYALSNYRFTPFTKGENPFEHLYIEDPKGRTLPPYTQELYEHQYHAQAMGKKNLRPVLRSKSKYNKMRSGNSPADEDDDKSEASSVGSSLPNSKVSSVDAFSKMHIVETDGMLDGEHYNTRYKVAFDSSKMCVSPDGVLVSLIERGGMTQGENAKVHDVIKVVVVGKTVKKFGVMATTPAKILRGGQSILVTIPSVKEDLIELAFQADEHLGRLQHIGGTETSQARNFDTTLMVNRIKKFSPDQLRIVIDFPPKTIVTGKELQKDIVKYLGDNCAAGEVLHVETTDESMGDGRVYVGSANGVVFYLAANNGEVLREEEDDGLDEEAIRQKLLEDQMGRMSLNTNGTDAEVIQ